LHASAHVAFFPLHVHTCSPETALPRGTLLWNAFTQQSALTTVLLFTYRPQVSQQSRAV